MITWLLSKLSGYLLPAAAIALAVSLLGAGIQTARLRHAQSETVEVRNAWVLDRAQATAAALKASSEYRAQEQDWQAQLTKAQDDYTALQKQNAKKLAAYVASSSAALADNGRLRDQLAAYASGGSGPADDTVAAASQRAAALGALLSEALRLDDEALLAGAESTGAAESNGDAVRALLRSWPQSISLGKLRLGS